MCREVAQLPRELCDFWSATSEVRLLKCDFWSATSEVRLLKSHNSRGSCVTSVWLLSHITHMNVSCHDPWLFTRHAHKKIWAKYCASKSQNSHLWLLSHITHMNESCHNTCLLTYDTHKKIWAKYCGSSHRTHTAGLWVTESVLHMNESCHDPWRGELWGGYN